MNCLICTCEKAIYPRQCGPSTPKMKNYSSRSLCMDFEVFQALSSFKQVILLEHSWTERRCHFSCSGKFDNGCAWRLKGQFSNWMIMKNNRTVFLSALSCGFLSCECSQLWVQPSDQKELDDSFKSTDFQSTKPLPKLTVMRFIWKWWRT